MKDRQLKNSEVCDPLEEAQTPVEPFSEEELRLILSQKLTSSQARAVYGARQAPIYPEASSAAIYRHERELEGFGELMRSNGCSGTKDRSFMPAGF